MVASPHPVDIYVGQRLRLRRTLLGLSQEEMGEGVGVTFQQVQKYERGINRIGASRLYDFAELLGVGVDFFFDGYVKQGDTSQYQEAPLSDIFNSKEILMLVRAYASIDNDDIKRRFLSLIRAMASEDQEDDLKEAV